MSQPAISIYQSSRVGANLTREMVNLPVSQSTLCRIENSKDKTLPAPEIVVAMAMEYNDRYLCYQHLKEHDPAAMMFIPNDVPKCSLLEATAKVILAAKDFIKYAEPMLAISVDGRITEDEAHKWSAHKDVLKAIVRAYIALECADGNL